MSFKPFSLWWRMFLVSILATILTGCTTIGGFNSRSLEHVTSLKATHLKFIDAFTAEKGRSFDIKKVDEEADKLDLKYREALEFAVTLDDKLRTSNIQALKEIFEIDLAYVKGKGRLLTTEEVKITREPSGQAYDRVVKGECARPSATCK